MKTYKTENGIKKDFIKNPIPDTFKFEGIIYEQYFYDIAGEEVVFLSDQKYNWHIYWITVYTKNRYVSKKDLELEFYIY